MVFKKVCSYEEICSLEMLRRAHYRARLGKRNKNEVAEFEFNLTANLIAIHNELSAREYKMKGYYSFKVHEPKERDIFAAHYTDRVVLHSFYDNYLSPLLERHLIYDTAACRIGRGSDFAINRFTGFLREYYKKYGNKGYILKCDISKYFPNIDHTVLKQQLNKLVKDRDIRIFLEQVIDTYETEGKPDKGLPLGNQSSQCFANYYLDPVDRLIKEKLRVKYYIRYMDDFLLIHKDKAFLKKCLEAIKTLVENNLKLKLNPKTKIFTIKEGIEFIGWRFYLNGDGKVIKKIKRQSKQRYKRNMKQLEHDYKYALIDLDKVKAKIASVKGHLRRGNTVALWRNTIYKMELRRCLY